MAWEKSTRSARLPKDWPTRRAKVKARAKGRCQARPHVAECDGIGRECDHIEHGDNHALDNLQWLSTPCHLAKTLAEAQAGSHARRAGTKLPSEAHPGWLAPKSSDGVG